MNRDKITPLTCILARLSGEDDATISEIDRIAMEKYGGDRGCYIPSWERNDGTFEEIWGFPLKRLKGGK